MTTYLGHTITYCPTRKAYGLAPTYSAKASQSRLSRGHQSNTGAKTTAALYRERNRANVLREAAKRNQHHD